MIDSHCHLDHHPLFDNISDILNRSKNAGLKKLLTICTSNKSFENIQKILEIDEIIYGTFAKYIVCSHDRIWLLYTWVFFDKKFSNICRKNI